MARYDYKVQKINIYFHKAQKITCINVHNMLKYQNSKRAPLVL
jgi:hypothetical protein